MKITRNYLTNIPLIALIVANIFPLWGVIYLGWDAFLIVLLYWAENIAVGFYTILKMAIVKVPNRKDKLNKLLIIPFFIVHYGGFMGVHGCFVLNIFKKGGELSITGEQWPCVLVLLQLLFNVIRQAYSLIPDEMKLALLALFGSHGISFVYNYIMKGEYAGGGVPSPYGRVFVMHIAVIGGAFLTEQMGLPAGVLIVLVLLKTIMDVNLHLREHKKAKKKVKS